MSFHLHAKVCLPSLFVHLQICFRKFFGKNKNKQSEADEQNLAACLVGPLFSQTTLVAPILPWLQVIDAIDQLYLPSFDFRIDALAGRPPTSSPQSCCHNHFLDQEVSYRFHHHHLKEFTIHHFLHFCLHLQIARSYFVISQTSPFYCFI